MKLFYSPGACSLAPHIVLREAGLKFELERTDLRSKQTAAGANYLELNPKGYVPALLLDSGEMLTEGPAISQYVADQVPEAELAPRPGTMERYRMQAWLTFIGTEIHKSFAPMFKPNTPAEYKAICLENLQRRLAFVNEQLSGKAYLLGERFSPADAYLFVMLNWAPKFGLDLSAWPALQAFATRMRERPAVQAALAAEA